MTAAYQEYRQRKFFNSLDGVRFVSILVVIWHHTLSEGASTFFTRGFLGVDMFFILSGYLIVTLLLREKEKQGAISLKGFYTRRALRIFPIYFGVLLGLSGLYLLLKPDDPETNNILSLLPLYLLFLANWSLHHIPNLEIYWSLATEEQFYIFWPLAEKYLNKKVTYFLLFLVIVVNQLVNFGLLDSFFISLYGQNEAANLSILDATFTPICLGVLLAHILHAPKGFTLFYKYLSQSFAPWLLFGLMLLVVLLSPQDISGLPRLLIQLSMFCWLASLVVQEEHKMKPLLVLSPIRRIGQISYGMYVFHMFAIHIARIVLEKLGVSFGGALFIVGFCLTALIAEISFRFYESPILSLRSRFTPLR